MLTERTESGWCGCVVVWVIILVIFCCLVGGGLLAVGAVR